MRADLYRRLQRLPVAFHDRWASGQLLSRGHHGPADAADVPGLPADLPASVNSATILVGFAILLAQHWPLGLVLLVPVVPLVVLCSYFESQYALAARRAQDQIGDLTTLVEESVLGIRIIKAFGRHRSQAQRLPRASRTTCAAPSCARRRLLADLWALITGLPELALGAALVLGVRAGRRRRAVRRARWWRSCPPRWRCAGRWSRWAGCWR